MDQSANIVLKLIAGTYMSDEEIQQLIEEKIHQEWWDNLKYESNFNKEEADS